MRRSLLVAMTGTALLALPATANASTFGCAASPATAYGVIGDNVLVSVSPGRVIMVCNLSMTVNSISPQTCAAWHSILLTVKINGGPVTFFFDSATVGVTSCASFSDWQAKTPYVLNMAPP